MIRTTRGLLLLLLVLATLGGVATAQDFGQLTPAPGTGPLACAPSARNAYLGQTAIFEASGGTGGYSWRVTSSAGTDTFAGRTLTVHTERRGVYTVILRDSNFSEATCTLTVGTAFTIGDGSEGASGVIEGEGTTPTPIPTGGALGNAARVATGPYAGWIIAFALSLLSGGLYLSYTHSERYRAREVDDLRRHHEPLDFKN